MGRRRGSRVLADVVVLGWVRRQSARVKLLLGAVAALLSLAGMWLLVHDRHHFFIAAEAVHAAGVVLLIYKLTRRNSACSGLSLKSQELTAIFLAVRLCCSFILEKNIHTVLDFATLVSTLWVIYMMRFKLKSSYLEDLDNMPRYKLVVPSLALAIFIHPVNRALNITKYFWAFCVYLESVAVFPQLRVMQNAKMVEPLTAHYVFALGVAKFLGGAYWIFQVIDSRGAFLYDIGSGFLWIAAILLAEIVQTFILADFCYYYVKSMMYDKLLPRLHSVV